jgi:proteasome activator subunit 4
LRRSPSELNESEKEIFDFFVREENIDKLMGFLSLEEHKGRDKFDPGRFAMFKGLFRNFGDTFL